MDFLQTLTSATLIDVQEYDYGRFNKRVGGLNHNALSYRIKSDATIGFSGKSVYTGDGSVTFFPKGLEYTRRCTHDRMLVLLFEGENITARQIQSVSPKNESIFQLFKSIVQIYAKKEHGYRLRAGSMLYELFYQLEREFGRQVHRPTILSGALDVISHKFSDPQLSVGAISQSLCVSEVYLRQLFSKNVGKSPKQYITDLRIERAKSLLKQSDLSVEAVATQSGFSEPKNFAVAFKNKTGITPTDYRKKYSSYI